jgi:hypothetical protein
MKNIKIYLLQSVVAILITVIFILVCKVVEGDINKIKFLAGWFSCAGFIYTREIYNINHKDHE